MRECPDCHLQASHMTHHPRTPRPRGLWGDMCTLCFQGDTVPLTSLDMVTPYFNSETTYIFHPD